MLFFVKKRSFMKSTFRNFMSMEMAVGMMILFALVSAIATFIENDFGIAGSRALIYNSKWFEAIQVFLVILIIYNMFRHKVFQIKKLPTLCIHLSFVIILIGAGITRYIGYEGTLHIREGKTEHRVVSSESFIIASAKKDSETYTVSKNKIISTIGNNNFTLRLDVAGEEAVLQYREFVPDATTKIVEAPDGVPMISMVLSTPEKTDDLVLRDNSHYPSNFISFKFNSDAVMEGKPLVEITTRDGEFYFVSNRDVDWFKMAQNERGTHEANKEHKLSLHHLYTIDNSSFAPKFIGLKGKEKIVSRQSPDQRNQSTLSAVIADVTFRGETHEVAMYGMGRGSVGFPSSINIGGVDFIFEWGSKIFILPFKVKLNDFQLDRHPGSMSPKSYASEIEVIDKEKGVNMPYRVYMNHVLDYRGFRFFQASYDTDEMGTVLSVNRDPGKWPTYIGYFILFAGLIFNLLTPHSRFRKLAAKIQADLDKVKSVLIASVVAIGLLGAGDLHANSVPFESIKHHDINHADNYFGRILVQSMDGRIKPTDTVSRDILNKVYRSSTYRGLSANQVVLGMTANPSQWRSQPIIHVFHSELKKLIGLEPHENKASFDDFFNDDMSRSYKLQRYAEEASRKKPAERNRFDKDLIKVDERVNIIYLVYTGEIFRIIPRIGDLNHKWYSPKQALSQFKDSESEYIRAILVRFFDGLDKGIASGDWSEANDAALKIKSYQKQHSIEVIPSESRIDAEIFYNNSMIFQKLSPFYFYSGLILLMAILLKMAKSSISLRSLTKVVFVIATVALVVHTFGLGLRWYISGHAPWTNSYEAMIYIAWSLILAGLFFSRRSILSLALTSILAGVTLFVAHLGWLDPQITTLIPVLDSYWLIIHVSVITASYGFFGLCSLLGFFTLILFAIKRGIKHESKNKEITRNIVEATRINEMSMILGIALLIIGNFLGGIWANESWGRYWGWDPKETWTLVTILVYVSIAHFRLIPFLNNQFAFAIGSGVAFASVLMTYFGVNYYLSGLHSYASGDPFPIPVFAYYAVVIVFVIIAVAFRGRKLATKL